MCVPALGTETPAAVPTMIRHDLVLGPCLDVDGAPGRTADLFRPPLLDEPLLRRLAVGEHLKEKLFAEAASEADRAVTLDRSDYRIHYLLTRIYTAMGVTVAGRCRSF